MTDYPTLTEVQAIHKEQIERYGGAYGVRDPELLEAALYRPQKRLSSTTDASEYPYLG